MGSLILIMTAIIIGIPLLGYLISSVLLSGGKKVDEIAEKHAGSPEASSVLVRKYSEADLNNVKYLTLAIGFIVAFSSSIYAFSWRNSAKNVEAFEMETIDDDFEIEAPQTDQVKPPPPPPPPPPPEIQVVEDEEILEDEPEIEDIEIEEDEIVEVPEEIDEPEPVIEEPEIFTIVEDMPRAEGCEKVAKAEVTTCTNQAIYTYVMKNVVYPQAALDNDIEGKVHVRFVVDENGNVKDVSIAKGVDKLLDEAAMKAVKKLPKFIPGKQRGKPVRVQFIVPVKFKIG